MIVSVREAHGPGRVSVPSTRIFSVLAMLCGVGAAVGVCVTVGLAVGDAVGVVVGVCVTVAVGGTAVSVGVAGGSVGAAVAVGTLAWATAAGVAGAGGVMHPAVSTAITSSIPKTRVLVRFIAFKISRTPRWRSSPALTTAWRRTGPP